MSWLISIGITSLTFLIVAIISTAFVLILQWLQDTFDIPMIVSFVGCMIIGVFIFGVWATHMRYFGA